MTVTSFIDKYFSYLHGKSIEHPNVSKSLLLHFFILLAVTGMLPTCARKIEKPQVISVSIVPMGSQPKETPKPVEQPKPEPAKPEPKPAPPKENKSPEEATKMEKAEKPKPEEKKEIKKPSPKKIEEKPKPEKKEQEEQKKDDRDQEGRKRLLKDLEQKKEQAKLDNIFDAASKDEKPDTSTPQDSGKDEDVDPALVNELMSKIQQQVIDKWNIPIGVKDVQNVQVRLSISLTQTGIVTNVKIMDQLRYTTDDVYRVIADSAVWAVREASPFQGLPADKYDLWKEIEFTFDPSKAL